MANEDSDIYETHHTLWILREGTELWGEKVYKRENNVPKNKFSNFMTCFGLTMMVVGAGRGEGKD